MCAAEAGDLALIHELLGPRTLETDDEADDELEVTSAVVKSSHSRTSTQTDADGNKHNGLDIECVSKVNLETPLAVACLENHVDVVKALIAYGADVNTVDRDGNTPLVYADDPRIVSALLAARADKNVRDTETLETPLFLSYQRHDLDVARLLLLAGADCNIPNGRGDHVLDIAISRGDVRWTELLCKHGADPKLTTSDGESPLIVAARAGRLDLAKALFAGAVDVNCADRDFDTPLIHAARNGHIDIVRHLLNSGASIWRNNIYGDSAIHSAEATGHSDVVSAIAAFARLRVEPMPAGLQPVTVGGRAIPQRPPTRVIKSKKSAADKSTSLSVRKWDESLLSRLQQHSKKKVIPSLSELRPQHQSLSRTDKQRPAAVTTVAAAGSSAAAATATSSDSVDSPETAAWSPASVSTRGYSHGKIGRRASLVAARHAAAAAAAPAPGPSVLSESSSGASRASSSLIAKSLGLPSSTSSRSPAGTAPASRAQSPASAVVATGSAAASIQSPRGHTSPTPMPSSTVDADALPSPSRSSPAAEASPSNLSPAAAREVSDILGPLYRSSGSVSPSKHKSPLSLSPLRTLDTRGAAAPPSLSGYAAALATLPPDPSSHRQPEGLLSALSSPKSPTGNSLSPRQPQPHPLYTSDVSAPYNPFQKPGMAFRSFSFSSSLASSASSAKATAYLPGMSASASSRDLLNSTAREHDAPYASHHAHSSSPSALALSYPTGNSINSPNSVSSFTARSTSAQLDFHMYSQRSAAALSAGSGHRAAAAGGDLDPHLSKASNPHSLINSNRSPRQYHDGPGTGATGTLSLSLKGYKSPAQIRREAAAFSSDGR